MAYKRAYKNRIQWVASYYVPRAMLPDHLSVKQESLRVYEPAEEAGYPNTRKAAEQLERRRKKEIREGTYCFRTQGEHTASSWLDEWSDQRNTRDKEMDRRRVKNHFLCFGDFRNRKLADFRPTDFLLWARYGRKCVEGGKMSPKTFRNAYAVVHAMFHDAVAREKIAVNPCVLSRGDLPTLRTVRGRRYQDEESQALVWCEDLPSDVRVLFCVLSFTAERIGEACGHTWQQWDTDATPLGALAVESQYDGAPLKTSRDKERPRVIPVHPELARVLTLPTAGRSSTVDRHVHRTRSYRTLTSEVTTPPNRFTTVLQRLSLLARWSGRPTTRVGTPLSRPLVAMVLPKSGWSG